MNNMVYKLDKHAQQFRNRLKISARVYKWKLPIKVRMHVRKAAI